MAIEIVSFPIKNGGSFHSYVNIYHRVPWFFHDGYIPAAVVTENPGPRAPKTQTSDDSDGDQTH